MSFIRKAKDALKSLPLVKDFYYTLQSEVFRSNGDNSYKYFKYPWQLELPERLSWFSDDQEIAQEIAQKSDKKKVVYIYPVADPGTFRYRVFNMVETLEYSNKFSGQFFFENEIDSLAAYEDKIDLLILCRAGWSSDLSEFVKRLQNRGIKVIYDIDGLIFDIDRVPLLIEQIAAPKDAEGYYFYFAATRYAIAKQADYFLATTTYLGQQLEKFFSKQVEIVPNFLNSEQISASNDLLEKVNKSENLEEICLGYFSGTKTHQKDFSLIAPALRNVLIKFPQVKLKLVGELEIPEELVGFVNTEGENRVKQVGMKNYVELQAEIASVDLNLLPLVINDFTQAKSELKFFEAGLVGVPTIASPTQTMQEAMTDNTTGYLVSPVNDAQAWEAKLSEIISNGLSTMRSIGASARVTSLKNYSGEVISTKLEQTLEKFIR